MTILYPHDALHTSLACFEGWDEPTSIHFWAEPWYEVIAGADSHYTPAVANQSWYKPLSAGLLVVILLLPYPKYSL